MMYTGRPPAAHPYLHLFSLQATHPKVNSSYERLLGALCTPRHPQTSPYKGDDRAIQAVLLLYLEQAAPKNSALMDAHSANSN